VKHEDTVRAAFTRQASHFGDPGLTLSSQELLTWAVDLLPLGSHDRVLDVAAGTGHLSRAIAPRVRRVVAVDMTRAMLTQAGTAEGQRQCVEADAARLPLRPDTFDIVVSRLALHHFEDPIVQLREMARVGRTRLAAVDLLSPDRADLVSGYNHFERRRDPSHTVALTEAQLIGAFEQVGASVEQVMTRDIAVTFDPWVQMTGTDAATTAALRDELERDIAGGPDTGMRPVREQGELRFLQRWCVIHGALQT
jgi:ubiquinone/menaquinone biosynthesis C-methylase UbiE